MVNSQCYSSLKSYSIQVGVSVMANWDMVNSGLVLGFPCAVGPPLLGSGPGLHVSVGEASWVVGLSYMSAPVACLLAGPLVDVLGRRRGLQLLNLTFASGWLLLAVFPLSLHSLYLGRILTGLGLGLATCVASTYTTEVVNTALRTALVTLTPVMMSVGIFLIYLWALNYQHSWTEASLFGFGITMLSMAVTPFLPESPLWLLNNGRGEEALQALCTLRGTSAPEQVRGELESFVSRVRDKQEASSWLTTINNLRQPQAYKPLLIMNIFFIFQLLSGVSVVIMYAVDFARDAGIETQAYYIALCIAFLRMLSAFITSWACSRYGRRGPALLSGAVMALSMLALATSLLLAPLPGLSASLILLYVLSSSVGFSALPWSMLGEVFPTDVRGMASGMTACFVYFENFIAAKLYPDLVLSLGTFLVFLFFASAGLTGTLFLYIWLPETHGKTLVEIENYFRGKLAKFINL